GYGRVGLSICYDSWFPEHARHLAWKGAELILNVVQTATGDRVQEVVLVQANAIANQLFIASVNCAAPTATGQSLLVDPEGRIRTSTLGMDDFTLVDVINLDQVQDVRKFGTAGVTRPWAQFSDLGAAVPLPFYGGEISPERWSAVSLADGNSGAQGRH
ncbi:carbon-nitrogen hydrolase family protein, partial [Arthrobacter sp. NPDC056886]|uniref:carbon-nitrogen hydrolase family protein n=1 Tax=Arthrobacter sp. NPDC056886 TaxID=3345960 RepID=UPI00366BBE74